MCECQSMISADVKRMLFYARAFALDFRLAHRALTRG